MTTGELTAIGNEIAALMPRLMRGLVRDETNALASGEVTVPQLWAIQYLAGRGPVTMGHLARVCARSQSSATAIVDRLVEQRLVSRARDPEDRRTVRVDLTARGRALLERFQAEKGGSAVRLLADLPAGRRKIFLEVLREIVKAIDKAENGEARA